MRELRSEFNAKSYTIGTEGYMANGDVYDFKSIMHYHSAQNADEDATCNSTIR